METETAKLTEAPGEELPGLPSFLAGLDGLIDPRACSKLAKLGEDYTETGVTLRPLDGATETRRIGPAPLSNFEPDFIQTAIEATGGGRVSVEICPPVGKPWRFLLELPETDPEPAQVAPAPAPASSSPELTALVAQLAAGQAQLQNTVNRMLDRLDARDATPKQDDDAELTAAVRDVKRELMNQTLAAIKGEDTRGRARIKEYLTEFREVVKDLAGVKTDIDATAAVLGGGAGLPGKPEPTAIELAEQAAGAVERIAQSPVGSRLLNKFFPDVAPAPAQPLLTDKSGPEEVGAIYG